MIKFKRLTIALLALLCCSATAWAQTETLLTTINASSDFTSGSKTFNDIATATFSNTVSYNSNGWYRDTTGDRTLTVAAANDGYTITRVKFLTTLGDAEDTTAPFQALLKYYTYFDDNTNSMGACYQVLVNGNRIGAETTNNYLTKIEVYGYQNGPKVTINDDKTEASFSMPQSDVTVSYSLKRDMAVSMAVTVQDAEQNSRFRVQKQGDNFVPYGLTNDQVKALFNVHDQIEDADLTAATDYTVQIFAADDNGQPTGTAMTFATFTYAPGQYIVKAVAADGSNYVGETPVSNVFTLYQGYEVEVAAHGFATYYSDDEALTLEESFAETAGLYTVASVTATEAQLSDRFDVAPAQTPMLIYNESETAQTVLLIPTTTEATVGHAAEFKGTAVDLAVTAAEVQSKDYYVLTDQSQFVWVKDAGTIAAHRCWIEVAQSQARAARRIVFGGEATGVTEVKEVIEVKDDSFFDLNGRKVAVPNRKGIYIQNGKKVVVK